MRGIRSRTAKSWLRLLHMLPLVLAFFLSFHAAASGPFNALHALLHGALTGHTHEEGKEGSRAPGDHHCDLCLKIGTFDLGSVASVPSFRLAKDFFSKLTLELLPKYSLCVGSTSARGPPSRA
jgi:hypothetical protein